MFEIKFKILENPALLKNMALAEFERECIGDLRGFFLLDFDGNSFGYLDNDAPLGVGDMNEEWLVMWFGFLNEVVEKLIFNKQAYVALKYVESSWTWIEFFVRGKGALIVSLLEVESGLGARSIFADQPFDKYTYGDWKNVEISLDEFAREVIDKTKKLIQCVKEINPVFLQTRSIQKLMKYVEDFEKLKQPRQ